MSRPSKMTSTIDMTLQTDIQNESYKGEVNAPCLSYGWFLCALGLGIIGIPCRFYRRLPFTAIDIGLLLLKSSKRFETGSTRQAFIKPMADYRDQIVAKLCSSDLLCLQSHIWHRLFG